MMEKLDYERRSWNIQAKVSHDTRNDTQTIKCIEILFKSLMQGKGLFCVAEQEKSHEKRLRRTLTVSERQGVSGVAKVQE